jgi:hypothetical protein
MAAGTTTAAPKAPPDEAPVLTFRQYAIAFHLTAPWKARASRSSTTETEHARAMASYERDMLLHSHRDDPPFQTWVVPTEIETATVRFPPEITYEAEGARKTLRCPEANEDGRTRTFGLFLGHTIFERSELAILSLVLRPVDALSGQSELSEYDVIKLVKLWEGGEAVADAPSINEGRDVWFVTTGNERRTLDGLATVAFPGWRPLPSGAARKDPLAAAEVAYRVGTVELELPDEEWRQELFSDLAALKRRREAPSDSERWDRAVAVGGILQGLLDFRNIEEDELTDVFADVDVDPDGESLRAFHKGTLLSLCGESELGEAERRPSPIGVDPYLAVPNIVLLHNEQRLKTARSLEQQLSEGQQRPRGQRSREQTRRLRAWLDEARAWLVPASLRAWLDETRAWLVPASINETEAGLGQMARLLAQHLPNVFHYSKERRLQKRGHEKRGLDDLETFVRLRIDDLSNVLESRIRARDRWTAVLGIAVGVVTAFLVQQAIEGRPLWLVVPGALALFGMFLWLRNRLF